MIKNIFFISFFVFINQVVAQNIDPLLLKSSIDEFELSAAKNQINIEFFYNDSVWLVSQNKNYTVHSFVLYIQKSKSYTERFYAPKGLIKGAAIKNIINTYLPFEIKIAEIKISLDKEIFSLPLEYTLQVQ